MPCDQVRYQYADFSNADLDVLRAALIRDGLEITMENAERGYLYFRDSAGRTGSFQNGKFVTVEGRAVDINSIKKAYTQEVIARAQKQYGFTVKKKVGNKITLSRKVY